MLQLGNLVKISTGVSIRSHSDLTEGGLPIVQMGDIGVAGEVNYSSLATIEARSSMLSHKLAEGDIMFRSRGLTNTAACFQGEVEAVLAAPLLRLSVKVMELLPEYLSWFINQPQSQHWLKTRAEGSGVKMISKKTLEMLPVEVPDLEVQEKIVAVHRLAKREQQLLTAIQDKRQKEISGILGQLAQGGRAT